jgi:hypothetical protein
MMAPSHTARFLGVAILWIASAACGGGAEATHTEAGAQPGTAGAEASPPAAPLDPLDVLPADAFAILDVNMAHLRGSAHSDKLVAWLLDPLDDPTRRQLARDLLDRTDHVIIGFTPPAEEGAHPDAVLVARGRLDEADVAEILPEGTTVDFDAETGRTVHIHGEVAAAMVDEGTWVLARPDTIGPALDRADRRAGDRGPLADPQLAAMAERIGLGGEGVTGVMRILPDLQARLGDGRFLARSTGQALRTAGLALRLTDGLDAEVVIESTDAASARALSDRGVALSRWASSNAIVGLLGLRPILDGTRIGSDGSHTVVALHLDDAYLGQLLSRLESLSGRISEMGGASTPPATSGSSTGAP